MAATTKTVLSTAASLAASAMLARTVVNDFLPHEIRNYIHSAIATFLARFSSQLTVTIEEFAGLSPNQMYRAAETYISTKISPSTRRLRVAKQEDSNALEVTMERGEETVDVFQGVKFRWRLVCHEKQRSVLPPRHRQHYMGMAITSEVRYLVLTFHKKHKDKALGSYLPYILDQSKTIKQEDKTIKIHTAHYEQLYGGMGEAWTGVSLDHPATFDTLAMDAEQKREVMEDLERFVRRKDYYRRVGKAWKRGYLLYGPPGTGKSSLIAAMANFLKFDVYDLELTEIQCNSVLRTLLVATANQSILVVEDIDCSLDLQDRKEDNEEAVGSRGRRGPSDDKVTLSGLLNFIDGLWSSCGDERIIVFTTNHKEKLDSALLRPGRMDKHIHMSYCTPSGFKTLLSNYHMVDNHPLVGEIEGLLQEAQATPAEVAEELMKSDVLDTALNGLIKFLQGKKTEASEAESKAISIESQGSEVQENGGGGGDENQLEQI